MDNFQGITKDTLVSIIIPTRVIDYDVWKCLLYCENLPNKKEIILVTDLQCPGLPATKRNWAMDRAVGKVFAFIDSDAYPSMDWLNNALLHLNKFSAVCGPGVLPADSTLLEQATDLVLRYLPYSYRVTPREQRVVAEYPTFNLIVRADKAPKFKSYLTGEDTLFCRELKGFILYDPSILVYHRRRALFKPYWKQISTYGQHRGYFIRRAIMGWLTTFVVYPFNFIKGFLKAPRENEDGAEY